MSLILHLRCVTGMQAPHFYTLIVGTFSDHLTCNRYTRDVFKLFCVQIIANLKDVAGSQFLFFFTLCYVIQS